MTGKELYEQLTKAYTEENLNRITGKLIALYKSKNFGSIREIANKVSKYVTLHEENAVHCFPKLVMLYHPDKGELFRKSIKKYYFENDIEKLTEYAHILLLNDIESIPVASISDDIDYSPEFVWQHNQKEGYYMSDQNDYDSEQTVFTGHYEKSFYNEIKIRQYGDLNISFPPHYLEDFEEFEMRGSGIESLDGVAYCKHVVHIDLSDNIITDLSELWSLTRIEELYLANNKIGYIDTLSSLVKLKVLDISGNQIDDISALFELDNLKYVNITYNPVPMDQIQKLQEKGVIVMC
ncbi:leucine-rich repeat domain-containing protein [candidate division KSB1 bacterium]